MATLRLPRLPQLPASLQTVRCDPATLYRVSGHATGEPYFGRANTYRFDDPHPQAAARFGTCYLGASLAVALAETLLHDRKPIRNHFIVGLAVIQARFVIRFTGETLILVGRHSCASGRGRWHALHVAPQE